MGKEKKVGIKITDNIYVCIMLENIERQGWCAGKIIFHP
jgi:hypothetical protein